MLKEFRVSLIFFILSLASVNEPQTLYVNPGCFKCFFGTDLSPANKNLFTISLILYSQSKRGPLKGILLKDVFTPKLLTNSPASCSLINFNFLPLHTRHFAKIVIRSFLVLTTFGFLLSVFCSTLQTIG